LATKLTLQVGLPIR